MSLGLLTLYALSRQVAGKRLREKEAEERKPVSYVQVGNEIVERDGENPDHSNAPIVGFRIGNSFVNQPDRKSPAVVSPLTGETMSIDQYKSQFIDSIKETDATGIRPREQSFIGDETTGFPEDYDPIKGPDPSRIAIPRVVGNISSKGGFEPLSSSKGSKQTLYGSMVEGKFSGWSSTIPEHLARTNGQFPTLLIDTDDGGATKSNFRPYKADGAKKATQFKVASPEFTVSVTDKDKSKRLHKFKLTSMNTTPSSQLTDFNSNFTSYKDYFTGLGADNPEVVKLRNFLTPIIAQASIIKPSEGTPPEATMEVNYNDAATFLRTLPNLKDIPGLVPAVQFAQNRISEDTYNKALKNINSPLNNNVSKHAQVKINDSTINFTVAFPKTYKKDNDMEKTASIVVNTLSPEGATEAQKNAVLEPFIVYERNKNQFGDSLQIKTKPNGEKMVADVNKQHSLLFFHGLTNAPSANKGFSLFPIFMKTTAPRQFQAQYGNVRTNANDELAVKTLYATNIAQLPNGYQTGHKIIMAFQEGEVALGDNSSLETKLFNSLKEKQFITTKTQQDFYADSNNKKLYSATTIGLLKRYKGTYFDPVTGKALDISTPVGNVLMTGSGIMYWADTAKKYAGRLIDGGDNTDILRPLEGSTGVRGEQLSEASMLDGISENYYRRIDRGKNDALYTQRQNELRTIAKGFSSNDATTRALAQRAYYRMMIAYQMAAAIQGGTGGRTISDQDVDNILKALGGASLTSTPEKELAGIDAALTLMQDIYQFNKHMTGTRAERNAALKHQEFITEGNPNGIITSPMGISGTQAAIFIESARGVRNNYNTGGGTETKDISDAAVLESINARQAVKGEPAFKSVEEAKRSIGDKLFEMQKSKINKM
jgi:hypothetical protein